MGSKVRRPSSTEPAIGVTFATLDADGRITIPDEFQPSLSSKGPPFDVALCLSERGCVTIYPADRWPVISERRLIEDAKKVVTEVPVTELTADQLGAAHVYFRLLACRHLTATIKPGWRLALPSIVRTWTRLLPAELRAKAGPRKRGRPPKTGGPGLVVVGNFGAVELWNETDLQKSLRDDAARFKALTTEMNELWDRFKAIRRGF